MQTDELISKLQSLLREKATVSEQSPPKTRAEPESKESENPELDPRPPELEGLSWRTIVILIDDGCFDHDENILRWVNRRNIPGRIPQLKYLVNNS